MITLKLGFSQNPNQDSQDLRSFASRNPTSRPMLKYVAELTPLGETQAEISCNLDFGHTGITRIPYLNNFTSSQDIVPVFLQVSDRDGSVASNVARSARETLPMIQKAAYFPPLGEIMARPKNHLVFGPTKVLNII